jgi:hypothetical protein
MVMASETHENQRQYSGSVQDDWPDRSDLVRRSRSSASVLGLPLAGLAAVGLGALAWYYLGPDLRRYLKIRSM